MRMSDWSSDVCSSDRSVVRFLGIPYAAPPQRFEFPQRPISWDGVRDMDDPGPAAPHRIKPFPAIDPSPLVGHGSDGTDGDYLRLNIWAPREAVAAPVMLLINGGGFVAGSKDRNSVGEGKSVYVRVDLGGSRKIK